ncbi:hypothetical protein, partial [Levilactobacillus fuyuanensis]
SGSKSGKCNLALTHKSQRLETLASNPGLIALEKTTRSTGGFYWEKLSLAVTRETAVDRNFSIEKRD